MRIHLWRREGDSQRAMIVPRRSAHVAPIYLSAGDSETLRLALQEAIETVSRAEKLPFPAGEPA